MGPEATAYYYSYITREYHQKFGDYAYPEIIIYSLSSQDIIDGLRLTKPELTADTSEVAGKVQRAIEKLHQAGADFVIAACNTIHFVFEKVSKDIPIPWISIMEPVAERITQAGLKKVALLGSTLTARGGFYQRNFDTYGIECIIPDADDQERVNEIIFSELVLAEAREASHSFVVDCINRLIGRGAQGVVLACTELPFLIDAKDVTVPLLKTSDIHAQKALCLAVGEASIEPSSYKEITDGGTKSSRDMELYQPSPLTSQ